MQSERAELIERTLMAYKRIMRELGTSALADEWVHLDLSMAQMKTLHVIACEEHSTIGAVAERLGVGLSAASHLVERLVQIDLVARAEDPDDRRRTLVRLTERGESLVGRIHQRGRGQFIGWVKALDTERLAALADGLEALIDVATREADAKVGAAGRDT